MIIHFHPPPVLLFNIVVTMGGLEVCDVELPDCNYREDQRCDALEYTGNGIDRTGWLDVSPLLIAGACHCASLVCVGACPEGYR